MTLTEDQCIHEMWKPTCAICLGKQENSNVANEDFYCGSCLKMVWRGDFVSLKVTTINSITRRRRVGECCAD